MSKDQVIALCPHCEGQWIVPGADATRAFLLEGACGDCQADSDSEKPLVFFPGIGSRVQNLPELPRGWLTTWIPGVSRDGSKDGNKGGVRRSDPETSKEAAEDVNVTALERMTLQILLQYGRSYHPMTVVEIWERRPREAAKLTIDYFSPRMKPLVTKGKVVCLGKMPRANRRGVTRKQLVYQAVRE